MSILNVHYDWMHCKHLGADQYIYGSILWLLVYTVLGGSPEDNLVSIWDDIVEFYKSKGIPSRYTAMKISMFIKPNDAGPKLRGKAAQVKDFAKPMLFVWEKFAKKTTPNMQKITVLLKANVKLEELLHDNKYNYAFPANVEYTFKQLVFSFLAEETARHTLYQSSASA